MDKTNMPLKRPRKHMDAFKHSLFIPPKHKAEMERQKRYRKDDLSWLKKIFKVFESVRDWFGGWFGGWFGPEPGVRISSAKPEKRYPHWFNKRIARNRRRRKLGNINRKRNR